MNTAAILFAADVIETIWKEGPSTDEEQDILDIAEHRGLIHYRKPTAEELADNDWWGHQVAIQADDPDVGDMTAEFRAAVSAARALPKVKLQAAE